MTSFLPGITLHETTSLCPRCLCTIPATIRHSGNTDEISLFKTCPEHGAFETIIWRGEPAITNWHRPKIPYRGGMRIQSHTDCPHNCGLCEEHNQRTCTALVEITERCNLHCPICFADSNAYKEDDPPIEDLGEIFRDLYAKTGGCNLQLSGGEPTVRDDLPDIVALAHSCGFSFIQLNSNGIRLADDPLFVTQLKEAGLSSVFLQFDGVDDRVYKKIRGKALFEKKVQAIDNLSRAGIGIVLVPTLVPEINEDDAWDIVQFGLQRMPHVRGVHFQPVSYFGRYPQEANVSPRHLTLPEVMTSLERNSSGKVRVQDFIPPGCEHSLCSFSAKFTYDGTTFKRLGTKACDCKSASPLAPQAIQTVQPTPALQGAIQSINQTARQWSAPNLDTSTPQDELDRFLQNTRNKTFSISAMAFQDCWTVDLERIRACCIHVATRDKRLIPFCAYNMTAQNGSGLYRKQGACHVQEYNEKMAGRKLPQKAFTDEYQLSALQSSIKHAKTSSPFYREHFKDIKIPDFIDRNKFTHLPFTDAEDIKKSPESFLACSQSMVEHIITLQSSGSTGMPKRFFFTEEDMEATRLFFKMGMKNLLKAGQNLLVLLPGALPHSIGALLQEALRGYAGQVDCLWPPDSRSLKTTLHQGTIPYHCIIGLPQHLLEASFLLQEHPIKSVETMLLCSDYVAPCLRTQIKKNCGARTFLHYGSSETCLGGGVECAQHHGVHLRDADILVEIIDPQTGEALPAGELGEIVITTLRRSAMPIIRYRTGDMARLITEPCPCGDPSFRLSDIKGRRDVLEIEGISYDSKALDDQLFALEGLLDYRLFYDRCNKQISLDYMCFKKDLDGEIFETLKRFFSMSLNQDDVILDKIRKETFSPDHRIKRTILYK